MTFEPSVFPALAGQGDLEYQGPGMRGTRTAKQTDMSEVKSERRVREGSVTNIMSGGVDPRATPILTSFIDWSSTKLSPETLPCP